MGLRYITFLCPTWLALTRWCNARNRNPLSRNALCASHAFYHSIKSQPCVPCLLASPKKASQYLKRPPSSASLLVNTSSKRRARP
ncbi:unnamed protein product [Chondrus crispus]|uniref:Secreted protein n=1 Tax=Chondrus crispus TaxID=2769 RepID=R7Q463_CHOCR|nr:unnamed protein product [Chondrus crispus]CDF32804.1 unnamed protein product [Chondrus crispus]|eukprot:XP_005712605.1 unnamed protein product [Chondrus crispus]